MLFYLKTFGCQMNVVDSQIVATILSNSGYERTEDVLKADIILFNTCSVRDNAEQRVKNFITDIRFLNKSKKRIFGIIGCMAQRLGERLLEYSEISFVAGPDSYRKLPDIIEKAVEKIKTSNTDFIFSEHYHDIRPSYDSSFFAYVPVSKGCNNMCSYCIVPFTRGPEKNRDINSILNEVKFLADNNYKEITLLGENVNSYLYKTEDGIIYDFADLLDKVATIASGVRIRFISSQPKDFTLKLIKVIGKYDNICNNILLPLQSGSDKILKLMNRNYTVEDYLEIVKNIRANIEDCKISTDIITGFCDEDDDDHKKTLEIIKEVRFNQIFSFIYSPREGTYSYKFLKDNVDKKTKTERLNELCALQHKIMLEDNKTYIGKIYEVLIEGHSKKKNYLFGRTKCNKIVMIIDFDGLRVGDLINIRIVKCTSITLFGEKI